MLKISKLNKEKVVLILPRENLNLQSEVVTTIAYARNVETIICSLSAFNSLFLWL